MRNESVWGSQSSWRLLRSLYNAPWSPDTVGVGVGWWLCWDLKWWSSCNSRDWGVRWRTPTVAAWMSQAEGERHISEGPQWDYRLRVCDGSRWEQLTMKWLHRTKTEVIRVTRRYRMTDRMIIEMITVEHTNSLPDQTFARVPFHKTLQH